MRKQQCTVEKFIKILFFVKPFFANKIKDMMFNKAWQRVLKISSSIIIYVYCNDIEVV